MTRRTVGILVSGDRTSTPANESSESEIHGIDLRSGVDLADALWASGHSAELIPLHRATDPAPRWMNSKVDGFVLALHGELGGSGQVHARMDSCGVRYCGPRGAAVALAYDKWWSRQFLADHNLPTPHSIRVQSSTIASDNGQQFDSLGWPCVYKPRFGSYGSGHKIIASRADLDELLGNAPSPEGRGSRRRANRHEGLLEREMEGTEVQVVLRNGEIIGSTQIENDSGRQTMLCPPDMSSLKLSGVERLAQRAATVLSMTQGFCRVDILVHPRYNECILEVESLPPLHRDGVVARTALAAGITYERLAEDLVAELPSRQEHELIDAPYTATAHA